MPDEPLDPREIEDDEYDDDDDVPFDLPLAEGAVRGIHKEDTEDVIIPDDYYESDTVRREINDATPDARDTQTNRQPVVLDNTVPNPAMQDDEDVPFRLPQNDGESDREGPVGSKWVTMPHDSAKTLPGSGGLDPNPDFANMQTVQGQTMPSEEQRRYQRPQQPQYARQPVPTIPPVPQAMNQPRQLARPLPQKRRRRKRNVGCLAIVIGLFLTFCGGLTLVTVIAGGFAYARIGDLLNERLDNEFDRYASFQSTFLYDRNGAELYEVFNEGRRQNVSLDQMPQHLINATVAIEDGSFFTNIGVDVPATGVAFLAFIRAAPDEQTPGGSTITQQLVRNVLFPPEYRAERSPQRKIEEILLAIALTSRESKESILELYLNEIYYGNLAYGAQSAAHVFFDKDVSELTLGEAALLAGLPQAPAELDPLNPDPAIQAAVNARWRRVLNEMVEDGFISSGQRDQALRDGLTYRPQDVPLEAPHFTVYAQRQLERVLESLGYSVEEIARGGFQVYTTVDLDLNNRVQQIAREQVAGLVNNNASNAAVVVLKPITGEVLAMVGSIDYNNDAIDGRVNVTTAFRQPGSTIKPFTYSAAIERGFSVADVIWDTRISIDQPGQAPYVPRNYDGGFHGPMRMRYALANSYNIPAVQTIRFVGVDYLLQLLERFGVQSMGTDASRYGVSLTLGGGEISPLELTRAFSVLANEGLLVNTQAIRCILDNAGRIIYQYEGGCPRGNVTEDTAVRAALGRRVLDERIAFIISDILADNSARTTEMGANSPLYTPNIASSVKTGTTDDFKDNWTVGYTRNVAIGVWVGNNNGDPMVNVSGLAGAAPIWNRVINEIYGNARFLDEFKLDGRLLTDQRNPPAGMSYRSMCDVRLLTDPAPAVTGCGRTINEWLLDSPAGVPDGQGGMTYPAAQPQQQQQVSSGSRVEEIEPGIYRTVVMPIAPEIAAGIQFSVAPGESPPPPPKYCRLPVEYWSSAPAGSQEQLFIAPPRFPSDAVEAERYANNNGLAFLPTIDCNDALINAVPIFSNSIVAAITSPTPNTVVPPGTPIYGTASFPEDGRSFFTLQLIKLDYRPENGVPALTGSPVAANTPARTQRLRRCRC